MGADGKLNPSARRINKLTKGALERLVASDSFTKLSAGDAVSLGFPTGMAAEAVDVVQLANNADQEALRAAGAALAKRRGDADLLVLTGGLRKAAELCFGLAMRDYTFEDRKSNGKPRKGQVVIMNSKPEEVEAAAAPLLAIADSERTPAQTKTDQTDRVFAMPGKSSKSLRIKGRWASSSRVKKPAHTTSRWSISTVGSVATLSSKK